MFSDWYVTSEYEEEERHDRRVAEVEEGTDKLSYLQFSHVVVDAVDKEIDCSESTS